MTLTEYAVWLEAGRDLAIANAKGVTSRHLGYLEGVADAYSEAREKLREVMATPAVAEAPIVPVPCNGLACLTLAQCSARDAGFLCTLKHGHAGPHSACGGLDEHNLHVWPQEATP